jgi:hypothetical protein
MPILLKKSVKKETFPKTFRVWTQCYRPFRTGGDVNQPTSAKLTISGVIDLGKGFKAYTAISPKDNLTYFIDPVSHGLLGVNLSDIKWGVENSTKTKINKQLAQMKKIGEKADTITANQFWSMLK